jgi:uncharacterized membrane protein
MTTSTLITLEERIARTERLLRRMEEDRPYLRARLSVLGAENRQSANAFADRVRAEAEAELARLLAERTVPLEWNAPQPADQRRTASRQPRAKPFHRRDAERAEKSFFIGNPKGLAASRFSLRSRRLGGRCCSKHGVRGSRLEPR